MRFLVAVGASLLAIVVAEVVLRLFVVRNYCVWPPKMKCTVCPDPTILPGVSGRAEFRVNEHGLRARSFASPDRYFVLALGGSTTECFYLDQTEAWPARIEASLNRLLGSNVVWVGNAGKSALDTRHNLVQLDRLTARHTNIQTVIVLSGVNDMCRWLAQTPDDQVAVLAAAFRVCPDFDAALPFYRRTHLWRFARGILGRFMVGFGQDDVGRQYARWRRNRQTASRELTSLPDMTHALSLYEANLRKMIRLCRARRIRLILATQPALWRTDLSPEDQTLLWTGGIGKYQAEPGHMYYSIEALQAGLELFNDVVRTCCRQHGVECVDLSAVLPKDTTVFYDDCHFNENGALLVAEAIVRQLCRRPPFGRAVSLDRAPGSRRPFVWEDAR